MIDSTSVLKDISALVGKVSPAIQARLLEAKIKECKKSITETRLDMEIERLEKADGLRT
ncbi:MAG TPA: hypothetical protein VNL14_14020 [Candidatus Acidoferrales bacterium]|nr:hypothetical protein [Candidatus Acidoferrales bacterium]